MIPNGEREKVEMRMMSGIRGRIGRVGECTEEHIGESGKFHHTKGLSWTSDPALVCPSERVLVGNVV